MNVKPVGLRRRLQDLVGYAKRLDVVSRVVLEIAQNAQRCQLVIVLHCNERAKMRARLVEFSAHLQVQREYELHLCEAGVASQDAAGQVADLLVGGLRLYKL